ITTDAAGKNVIAVGAVNHYNNTDWSDDRWVNAGPGMTPSQGPAADGRIKPDLCGPFDLIFTTDSTVFTFDTFQKGYNDTSDYVDDFGGTSGSAPVAAGAVGLTYQMYKENHFDNNPSGELPHASTVKAILIADAYQYDLFMATRFQQGWGSVDIGNVHTVGENHFIIDESISLQTGESIQYTVIPEGNAPLKVSLVWTDVPASPGADPALVNNLNLKVTDPDNNVYWGNYGLTTLKWSSQGGSPDSLNNVENVFIENPTPGTWTLEVIGANIPSDGETSTPEIDQAFALVASNVVETLSIYVDYPDSEDYVNDMVSITGRSSGDVTLTEVKIDNGTWQTAIGTLTWSYNWNTELFSDGEHIIHARAFNGSAYSEICSVAVNVDNTPPTTAHLIGEPKYFNGSIWIVGNSTQFTLNSEDGNGSGVNTTIYKIIYEGMEGEWTEGNIFELMLGKGNYSIQYYCVDNLGNEEDISTLNVYLDSTPPKTEFDIGSPKYRNAQSDHWNVTKTTNFTLSPFEMDIDINFTWYTIDGEYCEGLYFDLIGYSDGQHTITWGSNDMLGNNESGNLIKIIIDTSPPLIEFVINQPKYRANEYDLWNVTPTSKFEILPFDIHSGVDFTWYTKDDDYFEGTNFTFEGYDDGYHNISWGAQDHLGNNITGLLTNICIDSHSPITNLTMDGPKYRSSFDDIWNVTKSTAFILSPFDEYAGVVTSWYTIDDVYFQGDVFNLTGYSSGIHTITWGSIDSLGYNEIENSQKVILDISSPYTYITIGEPKFRDIMKNQWNITTETPFTLLPSDSYSGVKSTWYTIDDIYFEGSSFNLIGNEGYHNIIWGSRDNLGNNETGNILTVYLNIISPKTILEILNPKYRMTTHDHLNVTDKTVFTLSPAKIRPGINFTWYIIDGHYFEGTYFMLSGYDDGPHNITWGSEDNLGLNETGNSIMVILDTTPPKISVEIGNPKYRVDLEENWVVNSKTIFTLKSIDQYCSVNYTWYKIDGTYFVGESFNLYGYADGLHMIGWGGEDNLGNNMTEESMQIYLDDTPPITMIEIDTPFLVSEGIPYVDTTAKVNLLWNDGLGVGASWMWYSLDGGVTYSIYTIPFTLTIETTSIICGAEDLVGNNATPTLFPIIVNETDTDDDNIYDILDDDDDGDEILDENDAYPLDTDNDGMDNAEDPDDDSDGFLDDLDPFPFDTDNDGKRNDEDEDDDGDNINDSMDAYLLDTDNDGRRNELDLDDDNDGLKDARENEIGTDLLNPDTDGDGYQDGIDAYPLDKTRWEKENNWSVIVLIFLVIVIIALILIFFVVKKQLKYGETSAEGLEMEETSQGTPLGVHDIHDELVTEHGIKEEEREEETEETKVPPALSPTDTEEVVPEISKGFESTKELESEVKEEDIKEEFPEERPKGVGIEKKLKLKKVKIIRIKKE
ncbi:MAG: S8 family serine peptidase, partial [Thermoplasmata archaeon]